MVKFDLIDIIPDCHSNIIKCVSCFHTQETPEKEILWAAAAGDADIVKKLVSENPGLVSVRDSDGYTPIHRACYQNHLDIVQILLENQADISALTNEDWQPLHSASKWNSSSCVSLLMDWGADVNSLTKGGLTPLHLAASNPSAFETLTLLLNNPLIDPSIVSKNGETAFEIAQRCGPYSRLFDMANQALNEI